MKKQGLKKRPIAYTILSLLFIIEPIVKMVHLKMVTGFSYAILFNTIISWKNKLQVAEYYLLFPLAGLFLVRIRKGSYFIFLLVQFYFIMKIVGYQPYTWPYYTKEPILLLWVYVGINAFIILYFLHPRVRGPFFDRTVRWWESKTRYLVDFPCECTLAAEGKKENFETKILNISQTGAFIKGEKYSKDDVIELKFRFLDRDYIYKGKIVGTYPYKDHPGMGIQFIASFGEYFQLFSLILKIRKAGYKPVDGR
ncbi:MAG: PilZ domain-containing protein [Halobacteriovoraceae bacterium]|nr:PilZ domain-containing protein [Halobacteriovoraceae bacterium]MCB9095091.1 PilZ domain-containing protein [Halobacteriovoraceae bacterium]